MSALNGKEKKSGRGRRKHKPKKNSMSGEDAVVFQKTSWEQQRERQKLFKKLESEKGLLEKERKKVKADRAEVEKKRQLYLKEKAINDRLAIKYQAEKELWLERKKKKGHKFNKEFLMDKVSGKIKVWESKAEQAKQEWINIETERAEMKELEINIDRDQEQLKNDLATLERRKIEFEEKAKDLDKVGEKNKVERARLKVLEDPLIEEERKMNERIREYESYDSVVQSRETAASQKEAEQHTEGSRLEKIKQELLATLGKRKNGFNELSVKLYEQITNMDGSFAELFNDVGAKVDEVNSGVDVLVEQEVFKG